MTDKGLQSLWFAVLFRAVQDALEGVTDDHDEMAALQVVIAKSEAMLKLKRKRH